MRAVICLQLVVLWSPGFFASEDYWKEREQFLLKEQSLFLGSKLNLTVKERVLNDELMAAKRTEFKDGYKNPRMFPPARHFFLAKEDIDKSAVFKIIQKMPKGAVLHAHDTGLASTDFIFNLTYRQDLYVCENNTEPLMFHFFEKPDNSCDWKLLAALRANSTNETAFNERIRQQLTMIVPNPREKYPDIDAAWKEFQRMFATVSGLVTYRPVWEDYHYQVYKEYLEDNVMYLEFRGTLPDVYELNGTLRTGAALVRMYDAVTNKFVAENPDFLGAKFIYGPQRQVNNDTALDYMKLLKNITAEFPKFVVGFDLVGQEDKGEPLMDFVNELLKLPGGIKFFFHAGETNWEGSTDNNLIDAVLLNTTRIGHGYALLKHPLVLQLVKERGIGIEVNPISNQVLMLVEDMRNHPAAALLADDYPVVIASDDPSFWGATPLSHDMYEAFMGMTGVDADLRTLKQLAINSIRYSAMDDGEKNLAMERWRKKWEDFVDEMNTSFSFSQPFVSTTN